MKKIVYLIFVVLATSLFGSCNKTQTAEQVDTTALTLAVMPTMDCVPFYYADSLGIFDSLGVNIRLITFDAAMDADTAFRNGNVDGIVSDLVKVCVWQGCGDSVCMVMGGDLRMWVVTAQNARLLRAESLKEKIIGVTRHSAVDFFTDKVLESVKMKDIDLNKPQINNIKLRTLMVDQDQYDGAVLPEPFASEAVARGAKRLTGTDDVKCGGMLAVLFADSTYRSRKAEIDLIAKAYDQAVAALNTDTVSNVLNFIPKENCVYLPDTLYTPSPFRMSAMPSDSLKNVVRAWAKGRGLIK